MKIARMIITYWRRTQDQATEACEKSLGEQIRLLLRRIKYELLSIILNICWKASGKPDMNEFIREAIEGER